MKGLLTEDQKLLSLPLLLGASPLSLPDSISVNITRDPVDGKKKKQEALYYMNGPCLFQ